MGNVASETIIPHNPRANKKSSQAINITRTKKTLVAAVIRGCRSSGGLMRDVKETVRASAPAPDQNRPSPFRVALTDRTNAEMTRIDAMVRKRSVNRKDPKLSFTG